MKTICFYFQVHQPNRIRRYRFFDIGNDHYYWDDYANKSILRKVAEKCYLPANKLFLQLIKESGRRFKISYSLSGIIIDQFQKYAPDVIDSFKKLADTGCVEFLGETYSHSLSALRCKEEFIEQVQFHSQTIEKLFGQKPKVFRNTELIYSDSIGEMIADMGFKAILSEGAKNVLGWKSSNFMYCNANNPKLKVLLRNFRLSDDVAFRFSNRSWSEWPLTADKFINWILATDPKEEIFNLFMDYETFGEHQWAETGIFEFLKVLPRKAMEHSIQFKTPSEAAVIFDPVSAIHVPYPISWADEERDITAWLGNELQDEAFTNLYDLRDKVNKCNDTEILRDWKYLQTSDHFYYMCTKWFSDGDVHKYFNPYNSPYEAYINYMNALSDFIDRLDRLCPDVKPVIVTPAIKKTNVLTKKTVKKNIKKAVGKKKVVKPKAKLKLKPVIVASKTKKTAVSKPSEKVPSKSKKIVKAKSKPIITTSKTMKTTPVIKKKVVKKKEKSVKSVSKASKSDVKKIIPVKKLKAKTSAKLSVTKPTLPTGQAGGRQAAKSQQLKAKTQKPKAVSVLKIKPKKQTKPVKKSIGKDLKKR